jgi:NhaP-type Na+/H+ or K+/H+ antiporter
MYLGWQSPRRSAATGLQADAVWDMIVFVLEGLVFILVGLELPIVWAASRAHFEHPLAVEVAAVSATAVGIRLALVFLVLSLIQTLRRFGLLEARISWRNALVVGWAGMRGGESLAIALALPLSVGLGSNAGQRDLIIALTFGVILVTLVLQGLTLSGLIRVLDLPDDGNDEKEEAQGRALWHALPSNHLEAVRIVSGVPEGWVSYLREWYEYDAVAGCTPDRRRELRVQLAAFVSLRGDLIDAQRQALIRSRNEQTIGDQVMRRLQRELDLQASQLTGLPGQGGSG